MSSALAEPEGFEPSVQFPVHGISNPAPSATRSWFLTPRLGGRDRSYVRLLSQACDAASFGRDDGRSSGVSRDKAHDAPQRARARLPRVLGGGRLNRMAEDRYPAAPPGAAEAGLGWVRSLATEALLLVGSFAAGIVGVGLLAALAQSISGTKIEDSATLSLTISPMMMALAAITYRTVATSADPAALDPIRRDKKGFGFTLAITLALGVALLVGSTALSWLFERIGFVVVEQGRVVELTAPIDGEINPAVFMLAPVAVLAAPLFEEWLFRGWFFRRVLLRTQQRAVAYIGSAGVFAAIHGNVHGLPIYILQGLLFAYAYERTGRLWAAVGVHFINNAVTMLVLVFGPHPATPI